MDDTTPLDRTPVTNIRIMGRATQGVRVINLKDNDKVVDLTTIPNEEEVVESVESSGVSSVSSEVKAE